MSGEVFVIMTARCRYASGFDSTVTRNGVYALTEEITEEKLYELCLADLLTADTGAGPKDTLQGTVILFWYVGRGVIRP